MSSFFLQFKKVVASVLIACILGNQLMYINFSRGAEQKQEEQLVLILVEESILGSENNLAVPDNLGSKIYRYAQDIQLAMPQTKTLIMVVTAEQGPADISRLIKQVYYDPELSGGLQGVILIGDVPVPRVEDGERAYVSMYPYTDFVDTAFRYDEGAEIFVRNTGVLNPQAEIWHGVIRPPVDNQEEARALLKAYFDKNHAFHQGEEQFSAFDEKIFIADFTSENESINDLDWKKYEYYMKHVDEREYQRYNKSLLRRMYEAFQLETVELYDDEGLDNPFQSLIENVDLVPDVISRSIIGQYLLPMSEVARSYLEDWNQFVAYSGRWEAGEMDTLPVLIAKRDTFAQQFLRSVNDGLESEIDGVLRTKVAVDANLGHQIEPTAATLADQVNKQLRGIPDDRMPVDPERSVTYVNRLGRQVRLNYPNMFRLSASSDIDQIKNDLEVVLRDLARQMQSQAGVLQTSDPLSEEFFIDFVERYNLDLIADFVSWNNLTAPEKHNIVLKSYLAQNQILPQSAPEGYELLYVRGSGDARRVDIGIDNQRSETGNDLDFENIEKERQKAFSDALKAADVSTVSVDDLFDSGADSNDECGDIEEGVEIWEWFPAVACWLKTLQPRFTETSCTEGESLLSDSLDSAGDGDGDSDGDSDGDRDRDRDRDRQIVLSAGRDGALVDRSAQDLLADGQDEVQLSIEVRNIVTGEVDSSFSGSIELNFSPAGTLTVGNTNVQVLSGRGETSVVAGTVTGLVQAQAIDPSGRLPKSAVLDFVVWPLAPAALQFQANNQIYTVGEQAALTLTLTDEYGNLLEGDNQSVYLTASNGQAGFLENGDPNRTVQELAIDSNTGIFQVPVQFAEVGEVTIHAEGDQGLSADLTVQVLPQLAIGLSAQATSTPNVYQLEVSIVNEQGQVVEGLNSDVLLKSQPLDVVYYPDGPEVSIQNGRGSTLIQVLDTRRDIRLLASHLNYIPGELQIQKQALTPFALNFDQLKEKPDNSAPIDLKIYVIDALGRRLPSNAPVSIALTEASREAGTFVAQTVNAQNGRADFRFLPNTGFSGEAHLLATSPGLVPATLRLPLGYSLRSSELSTLNPQALYAMLLGFPAGDIMQSDYFGGWQLFSGKTQAVTAFSDLRQSDEFRVTFWPESNISLQDDYSATVILNRDQFGLEISDDLGIPIIEKTFTPAVPLQFGLWSNTDAESSGIFFEPGPEQGDNVRLENRAGGLDLVFGSTVLYRIRPEGGIEQHDNHFDLELVQDTLQDHLILNILFGDQILGRLHYRFPVALQANDFRLLNAQYVLRAVHKDLGRVDPVYALLKIDEADQTEKMLPSYRGEGFQDSKKQALLFAANNPLGNVIQDSLGLNELLLGDPTIYLSKSKPPSASGYEKTLGIPLSKNERHKNVTEVIPFEYNNDNQPDLLLRYADGQIDLQTGIRVYPYFTDPRPFLRFALPETDVLAFDAQADGDQDLLVSLENQEILLLKNENGVFREEAFQLGVESGISQMELNDLDQDGIGDLVVAFKNGNLRAYFLDSNANIAEIGDLGNYGGQISGENLSAEMQFSYNNLEPGEGDTLAHGLLPEAILNGQAQGRNYYSNQADGVSYGPNQLTSDLVSTASSQYTFDAPNSALEQPFLTWDQSPALSPSSKYGLDLNGGAVDEGDIIRYTITLSTQTTVPGLIVADALHPYLELVAGSVQCVACASNFQFNQNANRLFFGRINLPAGALIRIEYEAKVLKVPTFNFSFLDLPSSNGTTDEYPDIIVRSEEQSSGEMVYLISDGPRSYQASAVRPEIPKISIPELQLRDRNGNNVPDYIEEDADGNGETDVITDFKRRFSSDRDGDEVPDYYDDYPEHDTAASFDLWSKERFDWDNLSGSDGQASQSFGVRGQGESSYSIPPEMQEVLGKMGALVDTVSDSVERFKCGGGCLAMPINFAFLVPGDINAPFGDPQSGVGQVIGKMPGTPIVGAPGIYPKVICNAQECYYSGSTWRLYISPTLTGGIGFAFCFGTTLADPTAPRGGQCFVFAPELPGMDQVCEAVNAQVQDVISQVKGGVQTTKEKSTFQVGRGPVQAGGGTGSVQSIASAGGFQQKWLDLDVYNIKVEFSSNRRIPSFDDFGGIFTQWWDRQSGEIVSKLGTLPTIRLILPGSLEYTAQAFLDLSELSFHGTVTQKSDPNALRQYDKFLDGPGNYTAQAQKQREKKQAAQDQQKAAGDQKKQKQVEISKNTIRSLEYEIADIKENQQLSDSQKQAALTVKNQDLRAAKLDLKSAESAAEESWVDRLYTPLEEGGRKAAEEQVGGVKVGELEDSIQGMYAWIKSFPLLKVTERKIVFKYPFISKQAIEYLLFDLEQWMIDAQNEIDRVAAAWTNVDQGACSPNDRAELQLRIREQGAVTDAVGRNIDAIKFEKCQQQVLADKIMMDAKQLISDVRANIEILKSYKEFPRKLLKFKYFYVEYLDQILCIVEKLVDVFGGYFKQLKKSIEAWVELWETIQEIWETIGLVPEMFNEMLQDCTLCNNDRFSLSIAGLLALVVPDLPIIKFPKWPDVLLDISDIDISLNVPLPIIDFQAEEIIVPKLPRLRLPDVPSVNIELPGIPKLPRLPDLPDLPELPDVPIPQLPTIPPPPKLPEIFAEFKAALKLIEKILKLICLINKMVLPIPEEELKPTIERYTARPGVMLDLDFLYQLKAPDVELSFIDQIKIIFKMYLRIDAANFYEVLKESAREWNSIVTDLTGQASEKLAEMNKQFGEHLDQSGLFPSQYDIDLGSGSVQSQGGEFGTVNETFPGADEQTAPLEQDSKQIEQDLQQGVDQREIPDINTLTDEVDELINYLEENPHMNAESSEFLRSKLGSLEQVRALSHYMKALGNLVSSYEGKTIEVSEMRQRLGLEPVEVQWPEVEATAPLTQLYQRVYAYRDQVDKNTPLSDNVADLSDSVVAFAPQRLVRSASESELDFGVHESSSEQLVSYGNLLAQRRLPDEVGRGRSDRDFETDGTAGAVPRQILLPRIPSAPLPTVSGGLDEIGAYYQPCGLMVSNNATGILESLIAYDRESCDLPNAQAFIDANRDADEDIVYSLGNTVYLKLAKENGETTPAVQDPTAVFFNDAPRTMRAADYLKNIAFVDNFRLRSEDVETATVEWASLPDALIVDIAYTAQVDGFLQDDEGFISHHELKVVPDLLEQISVSSGLDTQSPSLSGPLEVMIGDQVLFSIPAGQTLRISPLISDLADLHLPNGFYYAQARAWTGESDQVMYSNQILLAPSNRSDQDPPILPISSTVYIPVNTPFTLSASEIIDNSDNLILEWDLDLDGQADQFGAQVSVGPFETLEQHQVVLTAIDLAGNRVTMPLRLSVFAPKVHLQLQESLMQGYIDPLYANVPVTVLRKRLGQWKALVTDQAGADGKYLTDTNGEYQVGNLSSEGVASVKDHNGVIAGFFDQARRLLTALVPNYQVRLYPADARYPMRFVLENENGLALASQVVVSDQNSDVQILSQRPSEEALTNLQAVTVFDSVGSDGYQSLYLPTTAPSKAGGVLIVDTNNNQAAALIERSGSIRLLANDLQLVFASEGSESVWRFLIQKNQNTLFEVYLPVADVTPEIVYQYNWSGAVSGNNQVGQLRGAADLGLLSATVISQSELSPFSDISAEHPQAAVIRQLQERGVVEGYEDGSFRPEARISRAEFVKIVLGATTCLDCTNPPAQEKRLYGRVLPFPDILRSDWFFYCVSKAKFLEMVEGYGDGLFHPERDISRAEAAAVLLRQAEIPLQSSAEKYLDVPDYAWYKDDVYTAVQMGLIISQNGIVNPEEKISRAEFAQMASIVMEIRDCREFDTDKDGMPDYFEIQYDFDRNDPSDAPLDADGDTFSNVQEYRNGTNPRVFDGLTGTPDNQNTQGPDGQAGSGSVGIGQDGDGNGGNGSGGDGQGNNSGGAGDGQDSGNGIDNCPEIPNNFSNIEYQNGCPIFSDQYPDLNPGIYLIPGDPAICGGIDWSADIMPGDIFMGAITSRDNRVIFERSGEVGR